LKQEQQFKVWLKMRYKVGMENESLMGEILISLEDNVKLLKRVSWKGI